MNKYKLIGTIIIILGLSFFGIIIYLYLATDYKYYFILLLCSLIPVIAGILIILNKEQLDHDGKSFLFLSFLCLILLSFFSYTDLHKIFIWKNVNKYIGQLTNKDEAIRLNATENLSALMYFLDNDMHKNDMNYISEALTISLKDKSHRIRKQAASALSRSKSPIAVDTLMSALNDPDDTVRGEAAWALGIIKDLRALDPLKIALNDNNAEVRRKALNSLKALQKNIGPQKPEKRELAKVNQLDIQKNKADSGKFSEDKTPIETIKPETIYCDGDYRIVNKKLFNLSGKYAFIFHNGSPLNQVIPDETELTIFSGRYAPNEEFSNFVVLQEIKTNGLSSKIIDGDSKYLALISNIFEPLRYQLRTSKLPPFIINIITRLSGVVELIFTLPWLIFNSPPPYISINFDNALDYDVSLQIDNKYEVNIGKLSQITLNFGSKKERNFKVFNKTNGNKIEEINIVDLRHNPKTNLVYNIRGHNSYVVKRALYKRDGNSLFATRLY